MTTQEAQRACMERLSKRMEDSPTDECAGSQRFETTATEGAEKMEPRLYTTAVVVIRSTTHNLSGAEDYQVFRATDAPSAALYARRYHERTHGKREPVARVRVYNSCDTCPKREAGEYIDHCGQPCCRFARYGDCSHAGTYTEYMTSMI